MLAFFVFVAKDVRNPATGGFYVLNHGGHTMVLIASVTNAHWDRLKVGTKSYVRHDQRDRIIEALGPLGDHLADVDEETLSRCHRYLDEETLSRCYRYLRARFSFPFAAHYPAPTNSIECLQYRCTALELLDPINDICDEFDGIFCKTRKGKVEVNVPLIDLEVPQDSPNSLLIEDYWFWFWNWR